MAKHKGGWTASERIAFRDLKYADEATLLFIQQHKEKLIATPVVQAVAEGTVGKEPNQVFGYIHLRRLALVFDAFMALAED